MLQEEPFKKIMREIEQDLAIIRDTARMVNMASIDLQSVRTALEMPPFPENSRFTGIKRFWVRLLRIVTRRQDRVNLAILAALEQLDSKVTALERILKNL